VERLAPLAPQLAARSGGESELPERVELPADGGALPTSVTDRCRSRCCVPPSRALRAVVAASAGVLGYGWRSRGARSLYHAAIDRSVIPVLGLQPPAAPGR